MTMNHFLVVAVFMLLMAGVGHLAVITGRRAQASARKALDAGDKLSTMQRAHLRNPGGQLIRVSTMVFLALSGVFSIAAFVRW